MVRAFRACDVQVVMKIWLDTNLQAHDFIPEGYWIENAETVQEALMQAQVYVYEDDATHQIQGFIGLVNDNDIAGIFVSGEARSKGIGKQLLDHVKSMKSSLKLSVYHKNARAARFYQRERFVIQSDHVDDMTGEREYVMIWCR